MRAFAPLLLIGFLAACNSSTQPVDATRLPPLSGREMALMTTAQAATGQGNYAQAEKDYRSAIGLSQGHVEAHLALAQLYLRGNQPDKARAVLAEALQLQPAHPEANYLLGKLDLQQKQPAEALRHFDRGLESAPQNLDLLNGKGIAHDMLRQHAAAQVSYLQAIRFNPSADLSAIKTSLSYSYLLDNKPDKAAELLKDEAKKPAASATTRHNLALAYGMLGRHVEARKILGKDMTEEQRQASLKRLAQEIAQRDGTGKATPPIMPGAVNTKD